MTPHLETARLVLRQPAESDHAALAAYGESPRSRFTGGPMDSFQSWRGLLATIGHWTLRGYGFFSIDTRADGTFVGRAGVIFHPGWSEPELAWHLFDGHEGRGYATEAARAARDWYYAKVSPRPLISHIAPENARSRAVAERLGAVFERDATLRGNPVGIWRHGVAA